MGHRVKWALLPMLLAAVPAAAAPVVVDGQDSLEARVARMERVLESSTLLEMRARLEQLTGEVAQLRGDLEQQGHELEKLQQQQRELYLDIDRRLQQSSTRPALVTPSSAPTPSPMPVVPPSQPVMTPSLPATQPVLSPPPAAPPAPNYAPQRAVPSQSEELAYQRAFALLKEGNYRQAIGAFNQQLQQFPQGSYADNARYWLGESHYVMRDFTPALAEFEQVLQAFPDSTKVPDAMLKIGYIRYEMKEYAEAQRLFETIKARYPGTRSARLADKRLQLLLQGR